MAYRLKPDELRLAIATLMAYFAEGKGDDEAREVMGLTLDQFSDLKKAMYSQQIEENRTKTIDERYVDYQLAQQSCVKSLESMIGEFKSTKQYNAMVGAIRARSDIIDKIVLKGQEFGLIEKKAEEKRIIGGVLVGSMPTEDLRKLIVGELVGLEKLVDKFGDGNILDLNPGETHRAVPKTKVASEKAEPSKTVRVHGGRRVVKTKAVS